MPEWLRSQLQPDAGLDWTVLLLHQVVSLIAGILVALLYRAICAKETKASAAFPTTLVMLTILICAITSVVGNNVAKAFSLVGALSIVRFRTVVEDTRDTAFVILAVACGMAIGSGYLLVTLFLIIFGAIASMIWRDVPNGPVRTLLEIKTSLSADETVVRSWIEPLATRMELVTISSPRQTTGFDYKYNVTLANTAKMSELVSSLAAREQVTGVNLERL